MTVHHQDDRVTLLHGDCLDELRALPDNSVDSVVTDPPYGLGFMGQKWDTYANEVGRAKPAGAKFDHVGGNHNPSNSADAARTRGVENARFGAWCEAWAVECLRVLKPGGHLLAFGGTRTWHRLACAIEDAGFEMRDSIAWLYGSGFPKSLNVSKAIEAQLTTGGSAPKNLRQQAMGDDYRPHKRAGNSGFADEGLYGVRSSREYWDRDPAEDLPTATDDARTWQGWGTALKPGWESVVVAAKPVEIRVRIGSRLAALEERCRQSANDAASSSAPTPPVSPEARTATAPASAATPPVAEPARTTPTGEGAGSSDPTDTSASASTDEMCSSIVTSWRRCWAELCSRPSTFTTGTTSGMTTVLTTLLSSLSRITDENTPLTDPTSPDGLSSLARAVDSLFAAALLTSNATHALTATEPVISPMPATSQGAGALQAITLARKPLTGTVAANVLAHGTGALNIDGCRIEAADKFGGGGSTNGSPFAATYELGTGFSEGSPLGRWPANVVLDESQAAALDQQSGTSSSKSGGVAGWQDQYVGGTYTPIPRTGHDDTGGASRFFYVAKAPTRERPKVDGVAHPTVKPLTLMRWLVRLVTPPGGVVLEPFAGSGTTVEAALLEGFRCVAIEREPDYLPLIMSRIERTTGTGAAAAETSPPTGRPAADTAVVPDLGPTVDEKIAEHVAGQLPMFDEGVA